MLSMLQASENGQRAEQQMPPFKFEYLKQAYFVALNHVRINKSMVKYADRLAVHKTKINILLIDTTKVKHKYVLPII